MSAIGKIYWLSREPEFLEDMWSATWSHLFSGEHCECCGGQLYHGLHPPTHRHAVILIDIMIKSNKMVQLLMQWLYNNFLGTANSALVKALGTRFDQFAISLKVYRPGKVAAKAWKTSQLVTFNNYAFYSEVVDMSFVTFNSGHVGIEDWYERTRWVNVEGKGLYPPISRQALTVTGQWYNSSGTVFFGNVVGDCRFEPIDDCGRWEYGWDYGWEFNERDYIQHHELVFKADDTEYARTKARRSKSRRGSNKRIPAYWRNRMKGNLASDRMKGSLASDIAHDLKEYYEDCNGSNYCSCDDNDHPQGDDQAGDYDETQFRDLLANIYRA